MKRLLYILIGIPLLMEMSSCTEDSEDSSIAAIFSDASQQDNISQTVMDKSKGTFDLVWVVDNEIVDTATFSNEHAEGSWNSVSHFPMAYFLNLVGKNVKPEDVSYQWGMSYWYIFNTFIGYSANNAYVQNSTWAPQVWCAVNGDDYSFLVYLNDESDMANWYTPMIYDMKNDVWSGAAPVYKFQLINHATDEWWEKTFTPPINMTFQTTGRKK